MKSAFFAELTIIDMHLKLKRTPGLYLVGFMASGKTTVGSMLARHLGWKFIDIDAEIERLENRSVAQIFRDEGEAGFRDLETSVIQKLVHQIQTGTPRVVALGGGAFIQERNWQVLKDNGITVWLDCPLDLVHQRLGNDTTRPLATDRQNLVRLYEDRRPLYSRADFRIDVDSDDVSSIVARITALSIF